MKNNVSIVMKVSYEKLGDITYEIAICCEKLPTIKVFVVYQKSPNVSITTCSTGENLDQLISDALATIDNITFRDVIEIKKMFLKLPKPRIFAHIPFLFSVEDPSVDLENINSISIA